MYCKSVWLQAHGCDKGDYINCLPLCLHIETDLFYLNVIDCAGFYVAYFEMVKFLLVNEPAEMRSVTTESTSRGDLKTFGFSLVDD